MSSKSWTNFLFFLWKRNNWVFSLPRFFSRYGSIEVDRPIFFVGNQGGGLTLASRMLRRHPQVVSITGDHRYWSGADEMQNVMMWRLPRSLWLGGRFFCKDFYHKQFTPPRSWSYGSDDLIGSYRKTAADYDPQSANKLCFLIRETLHRYGKGKQGLRFTDKSQVFTVKMSYVDALLKDTNPYFVLITRNPYAACYRAAMGKAGDMRRYAKYMSLDERVAVCTQHWSNVMRCVLEDKDKVSNFKFMRFEDILQDPRQKVMELCDFIDLPFAETMIPGPNDTIPFGSKYSDRWYPMRPDVNTSYLEQIPDKYVAMIAKRCGAIAAQFGYSFSRPE